ncbi:hypothetical protein QFZ58_002209 [Streptomyces sp. B1I3]|nr:hypothetical protein [Streptomyces sp. B1I3]
MCVTPASPISDGAGEAEARCGERGQGSPARSREGEQEEDTPVRPDGVILTEESQGGARLAGRASEERTTLTYVYGE